MASTPCTRCGRTLPPDVVRDLSRGTRCPFCAALLERPKSEARARTRTPTGRASVLASTIAGHTTGSQASPAAPPDPTAWLSSLLRAKAWETSPAVPAVEAPAPTIASATPAVPLEVAAPPAPSPPVEAAAPPPAVEAHTPPPTPIEALPELPQTAFDTSGPVQAAPAQPPPPTVEDAPPPRVRTSAAPLAAASDLETDAVPVVPVARNGRVLIALGAVALGVGLAVVLRASPAEVPPAPAVTEPAPAPAPAAAPEAPAPAPAAPQPVAAVQEPKRPEPTETAPPPAAEKTDEPRAHHHHEASAERADAPAPAADDGPNYRAQAQALEKEGKIAEALAAYQQALGQAKRAGERQRIARRMYDLTHPGE
jgi:hypothetical protein